MGQIESARLGDGPRDSPYRSARAEAGELRRAEAALARRAEELAILYRFTDRLYRSEQADDVSTAALDAITAALRCERASILLADADGVMRFSAWRGLSDGYRKAVEGHSPWAAGDPDPQPVWVADIDETDEPDAIKAVVRAEGVRGLAFIPLMADGRLAGKFMAYYPDVHAFRTDETELAVIIARQLGFALEQRAAAAREKANEAERAQGEAMLTAMFEHAGVGMKLMDASGVTRAANRAFARITGRRRRDLIGRSTREITHPDDVAVQAEAVAQLAQTPSVALEKRYLRPDGTVVWVRITLSRAPRDMVMAVVEDVTERIRGEEQRTLLINELNHRVKNTLATVQSLAGQTLRSTEFSAEAKTLLESRLAALARAHDVLTRENWSSVDLRELVDGALAPFRTDERRISIAGPRRRLGPNQALAMSIALHELATNAAKYGALSTARGHIDVRWGPSGANGGDAELVWTESGGPAVEPPTRRGFGSRLIEEGLGRDLGAPAAIDYRPGGVVATIGLAAG